MMLLLLAACGIPDASDPCACVGMGVVVMGEGECACLAYREATPDPEPLTSFRVTEDVDWSAVNAALSRGDVSIIFDAAGEFPRQHVERTDPSAHRLTLLGSAEKMRSGEWTDADGSRANVEGVYSKETGTTDNVTVRGFNITGSSDKGVAWRAGSGVVIEDNLIHDNAGSPALYLDYSSRTGHRSTGFSVRNNHIYAQGGECVYIGGSEGEDADSHSGITIEGNLIHDCFHRLTNKTDGINIKDRLSGVVVRGNVVINTDWGIEVASPGLIEDNLVIGSQRNGFHITDEWGLGMSGLVMTDNAAIWTGDAGAYLNATANAWSDVTIDGFTVVGPGGAGIELGGEGGISGVLSRILVVDATVGLDAWSPMDVVVTCHTEGVAAATARELAGVECGESDGGMVGMVGVAGADGVFFTADDPWRSGVGAEP
ncbi:MAG: hypothetical protein ACI8RZ_006018 [Myxococcota bacterium]|jgi:hypothetical protein